MNTSISTRSQKINTFVEQIKAEQLAVEIASDLREDNFREPTPEELKSPETMAKLVVTRVINWTSVPLAMGRGVQYRRAMNEARRQQK